MAASSTELEAQRAVQALLDTPCELHFSWKGAVSYLVSCEGVRVRKGGSGVVGRLQEKQRQRFVTAALSLILHTSLVADTGS